MAWFTAPSGVVCQAAYDAVGAASLADSYVNEANPGTYTAAPGVAPTWAYGTGWVFNGSTQYLTTGLAPVNDQSWSLLVRFSGGPGAATRFLFGSSAAADTPPYFGVAPYWVAAINLLTGNGGFHTGGTASNSGVVGFAGNKPYVNAVAQSGTIGANAGTINAPYIGARNRAGTPVYFWSGSIQALAIYSGTLTAADVVAITTTMNALPVAASAPTMMQHHHAMLANRR